MLALRLYSLPLDRQTHRRGHMSKFNLDFVVIKKPDFSGFNFYVEAGKFFDANDYADAYSINRNDISHQDIHSAQDAAGSLNEGEFLHVSHNAI